MLSTCLSDLIFICSTSSFSSLISVELQLTVNCTALHGSWSTCHTGYLCVVSLWHAACNMPQHHSTTTTDPTTPFVVVFIVLVGMQMQRASKAESKTESESGSVRRRGSERGREGEIHIHSTRSSSIGIANEKLATLLSYLCVVNFYSCARGTGREGERCKLSEREICMHVQSGGSWGD